MTRSAVRAFLFDTLCVLVMVVIGTRNHDTDTGISGVLYVAAPFWIAVFIAHVAPIMQRTPAEPNKYVVWGYTVVMGMVLRNYLFDRGTAPAFIIVASVFLGATMLGWRAVLARRTAN